MGSLWSDITSASNSMFETFEEGDVIPQPVTIASRFSNSVPRFFKILIFWIEVSNWKKIIGLKY